MKKIWNIVIGGLQQKIFNLVLLTLILVVLAFAAVTVYQASSLRNIVGEANERQQAAIRDVSAVTMEGVVDANLSESVQMQAYIADGIFQEMKNEVELLADYAGMLYQNPDQFQPRAVLVPDVKNEGTIAAQLLSEEGVDFSDPKITEQVGLIGNLTDTMEAMLRHTNLNSCFIGTADGVFVIVDEHSGTKFNADGSMKHIAVRDRFWYTGALESGTTYFSDVEHDAFADSIGIVCTVPIYVDGELKAIVGADLFLEAMEETVKNYNVYGKYIAIINQDGHTIFAPDGQDIFHAEISDDAEDLRQSENEELAAFVTDVLAGATDVRLVNVNNQLLYMNGAKLSTVGWALISVVDQKMTEAPMEQMVTEINQIQTTAQQDYYRSNRASLQTILVLLTVILILATTSALVVAKRIVKPLNTMTKRMSELSGTNLQFMMEDTYRTGDEIEVLATSFANLSAKTTRYIGEITRITAEKERIGAELNMAKDIQESQLPSIFPPYPDRKEFDIYASMDPAKEVGGDFYDLFLIDHDHLGLVMADVSGKGVPAALFMMISKILIKNRVQSGDSPAEALRNVNNQIMEGNQADMFVTVWLGILNLRTGEGVAANAGHEHPALKRADGQYELIRYRHSPAIGTMEGIPFKEHTFTMNPGDGLFVYTDGVPEATSIENELFGTDRMLEALNRNPDAGPKESIAAVTEAIDDFVAGAEQFDDTTMLCLVYHGSVNETEGGLLGGECHQGHRKDQTGRLFQGNDEDGRKEPE